MKKQMLVSLLSEKPAVPAGRLQRNVPAVDWQPETELNPGQPPASAWYSKGQIQARTARFLHAQGFRILQLTNPAVTQDAADILAQDPQGRLWMVTVKGYPQGGTPQQASAWFTAGVLDLLAFHEQQPDAALGMALPEAFQVYQQLAQKVGWLKQKLSFVFFWADAEGKIRRG
ncbi:MAG TPA: hypothetical protein PKW33_17530 [Anaerolineaceae bacterium]|nr:hypothetical protein [Anaerolineaceae bacterium]HPN53401.1 hypothetical protein [Anaerolineaceae bacterium]